MKNNNQIQQIITYIPLITKLVENGFSYKEISDILKTEYHLQFNSQNPPTYINNIIFKNNKNQLNRNFDKFKILRVPHQEKKAYDEFCVGYEYGFHMTYNYVTVNDEYLVTEKNIHLIPDIKGCILAKRILKFHMLPDAKIITAHNENYKTELSQHDTQFIKGIHDIILDEFNKLHSQLRIKPFFYKGLI